MKKLFALLFAAAALLSLPQCDVIDQPFKGTIADTTSTAQLRNVLIEDFTGHRCKNCPKASKAIKDLEDAFGRDRVIGLAIHAGPGNFTGVTTDYPTDFTTQGGKEIQNFFGTNFLPVGMVNRENWTPSGNTHWSNYANWPTLSAEAMDSTLRVSLNAVATKSGNTLSVEVEAMPTSEILHDLHAVVMLKESNIVSPQLLPDDTRDPDYVHMNVLRAFLNGTWGSEIGTSPLLPGDALSDTFTLTWNNDWQPSNCEVIFYVYNPDNYRILQVIQVPVE